MPLKNLLRASFMVTLNGHKQGHVHIGNARIQRGYVYRESGTPWKTTSSIEKKQLGPIALEKVGAPDIFNPPPPCLDSGKIIVSLELTSDPHCKIS